MKHTKRNQSAIGASNKGKLWMYEVRTIQHTLACVFHFPFLLCIAFLYACHYIHWYQVHTPFLISQQLNIILVQAGGIILFLSSQHFVSLFFFISLIVVAVLRYMHRHACMFELTPHNMLSALLLVFLFPQHCCNFIRGIPL